MTGASAYRDALRSFVQGYQEGIREVLATSGARKSILNEQAMEGEETGPTLPEHLVERILTMVPFPYMFKARGLSKSWLAKFSSISSLGDDKSMQLRAILFQEQLCEYSNTWKTLCPVFFEEGRALGYDRECDKWRRMPSLSFLPDKFLNRGNLRMEGPLLYALPNTYRLDESQLYVANILTQSWNEVPQFPDGGFIDADCQKLVIDTLTGTFKVIRFCRPSGVHTYDSKSGRWSYRQELVFPLKDYIPDMDGHAVFLKGILYILTLKLDVVAYDVEKGTFEVFNIRNGQALEVTHGWMICSKSLVVCHANLLITFGFGIRGYKNMVFKIDLDSKDVCHVSTSPLLDLQRFYKQPDPVTDSSCIFFGIDTKDKVVTYNIDKDEWSFLPVPAVSSTAPVHDRTSRTSALRVRMQHKWSAFSFQPSCSPFLAV